MMITAREWLSYAMQDTAFLQQHHTDKSIDNKASCFWKLE